MLFILIISYLLLLKMSYCRKIHLHKSKFYDIMYIDEQASYNKKGIRLIIRIRHFLDKILVASETTFMNQVLFLLFEKVKNAYDKN